MNWYTYVVRKSDNRNLGLFIMVQNALGGLIPNRTYVFCKGTAMSETSEGYIYAVWFQEVVIRTSRVDKEYIV